MTGSHSCDLGVSTCINTLGAFTCQCASGYKQIPEHSCQSGQIGGQTGRNSKAGRQTDGQTQTLKDRQTQTQTDRQAAKQTGKQANGTEDREIQQINRQTDKQTDSQTD